MIAVALIGWMKAKRDGYNSPLARMMRGGARAAAYIAVVSLVGALWTAKRAHAKLGEGSLEMGRELSGLMEEIHDVNRLTINGEHLNIAMGGSDQSVSAVLDHFEAQCQTGAGVFQDAYKRTGEEGKKFGLTPSGAVRSGGDGEGTILCMDRTSQTGKDFVASVKRFTETKDLGAIGKIRYAYVTRTKSGKSQIMTLWSDDSLRLNRIAPEDGQEGAGPDPTYAPRPPSSRRLVSVGAEGTPYAATMYTSTQLPQEVLAFYETDMTARGYESVSDITDRAGKENSGNVERMFVRDGILVTLAVQPSAEEGGIRSRIAIVEAGGRESFTSGARSSRQ
jgi:hypothetical protein